MTRQQRYSWDDLWQWALTRNLTMNDLAQRVGSDRRELYRWREAGGVPESAADRVAVKLGVTPCEIWAKWHEVGMAMAEAEDARRRALRAATKRRYRAKHPDYAERQRAYRAAYYADAGDFERARQRRYYEANAERERARVRAYGRRRENQDTSRLLQVNVRRQEQQAISAEGLHQPADSPHHEATEQQEVA